MPLLSSPLSAQQLRKANRFSWLYAIGMHSIVDDKASFHAIGPIGGVDDKP